jgi:cell wall-associated NlpC family hydrolase
MIAERLAAKAEEWEAARVPYVHRGMRRTGCDCTGLIIGCLQELGFLRDYKLRRYPRDWNMHAAAGDFIRQEIGVIADPVVGAPQRGDIILFRFGKCVAHAGILVKPGVFCHCTGGERRVRRGLLRTAKWVKRMTAIYRLSESKLEVTR